MKKSGLKMKMFSIAMTCILCATSVIPGNVFAGIQKTDKSVDYELSKAADYGLVENVQDGVILHCWNWSYKNISANMEAIAEAGYSAVQTSPIQYAKEGTTGKSVGSNWWVYYQPAGFWIDNTGDSALGNKASFTAMCTKAEEYGIKVIVDVVANHVGNGGGNDFASTVDSEIKNDSSMIHTATENSGYTTRHENTQKCICECPDLNTGNSKIQTKVLDFLKECIDCGADGFRFDAAKHIETPDDESYFASQFWPTVINGASSYYSSKTSGNLYCYGEILDNLASSGNIPSITAYTKHMSITANESSNNIMKSIAGSSAEGAASSWISLADKASKAVLWAESHDTWANDNGYLSRGYSTDKVQRAWALIGSRAKAAGLYFARPTRNTISTDTKVKDSYDATSVKLGEAKDTGWKDKQVVAVNHFHNYFVGTSEYLGYSGEVAYNVRYNVSEGKYGVVLCKVSGGSKSIDSMDIPKMANGTYKDEITGNTFTVSGGKITGQIGDTGIAVVYNEEAKPTATISQAGGKFKKDSLSVTFGLKNATSGTYKLGDSAAVTFTKETTIEIGEGLKAGESITITLTATDGITTSAAKEYVFTKAEPSKNKVVYCKKPSSWTGELYVYIYDGSIENAKWPGVKMTKGSDGIYSYEVPETIEEPNVIFYAGSASERYPGDGVPGLEMTSNSMIYEDGKWKEYKQEDETTSKQDETTSKQDETTSKQDETTSKQDETTSKQDETTSKQDETTSKQDETTSKQDETTSKQDETTSKQDETTSKQDETTSKQDETTSKQDETTSKQDETTSKQDETTSKQEETTSKQEETTKAEQKLKVLSFTTSTKSGKAIAGKKITLSAKANKTVKYKFTATKKGGKEVVIKNYSSKKKCSWKAKAAGSYTLKVYVKDNKKVITKTIKNYKVVDKLKIKSFTASKKSKKVKVGENNTLSVKAIGGVGQKYYEFYYIYGGSKKKITNYTSKSKTVWKAKKAGTYVLCVTVEDDLGNKFTKKISKYVVVKK